MLMNGLSRQMPLVARSLCPKSNTVIAFGKPCSSIGQGNTVLAMRMASSQRTSLNSARFSPPAAPVVGLLAAGTLAMGGYYAMIERTDSNPFQSNTPEPVAGRGEAVTRLNCREDEPNSNASSTDPITVRVDIPPIDGLKTFTTQEVAEKSQQTDRFLVTLGSGVYDLTEFIDDHPGGAIINLSRGQDLSKYWNSQRQHFKQQVFEILEQYRIGNLDKPIEFDYGHDPYSEEAPRELLGRVFGLTPYNAEPEDLMLTESGLTPVEDLFVRNHKPMPTLDREGYTVQFSLGEGFEKSRPLKLHELFSDERKVERRTLVLACGGQRRAHTESKLGSPWTTANANVEVSGINLKSLLADLGLNWETVKLSDYLVLEGDDGYKSSIPLLEIPDHSLLANEMNGEPLTNDHGYPVRAFFEGYAGHFHIKRLRSMQIVRDFNPATLVDKYQLTKEKDAYKVIVEGEFKGHLDQLPLQSLFAGETPDSIEEGAETSRFEGVAYTGRANIERVEVSFNPKNGDWIAAELHRIDRPGLPWVQWSVEMPTADLKPGLYHAYCRAFDDRGGVQPELAEENRRGLGCNSYHKVAFEVEASDVDDE